MELVVQKRRSPRTEKKVEDVFTWLQDASVEVVLISLLAKGCGRLHLQHLSNCAMVSESVFFYLLNFVDKCAGL